MTLDIIVVVDASRIKFTQIKGYTGKAKIDIVPFDDFQGTADALRCISDRIRTDFILVSTDVITDAPLHHLTDLHRVKDAMITSLLVQKNDSDKQRSPDGNNN